MKKSKRKKLLFYNFGLIAVIAGCIFSIFQMIPVSGASFRKQEDFKEQQAVTAAEMDVEQILISDTDLDLTFSFLVADLSEGKTLDFSNTSALQKPMLFAKHMVTLTALQHGDPKQKIVLTDKHITSLILEDKSFPAAAQDVFLLEDFILYFVKSQNIAAAPIIAEAISGDQQAFVDLMNQTAAELKTANTNFKSLLFTSQEGEYTTVYDMYLISCELLTFKIFVDSLDSSSVSIHYESQDGASTTFTCESKEKEALLELPSAYTNLDMIAAWGKKEGGYQLNYVKDKQGNLLIVIFMGALEKENLEKEAAKVKEALETKIMDQENLKKEPPKTTKTPKAPDIPEIAVLPTEDDEARYQYLFESKVQYYTMDNRPAGYESSAAAAKNMTTIQVPVWKMRSDGSKYSSKYALTINAKLAESVKCIFDEIYAMKMQFPVKYLVGYAYRKVGGVGLAKSNLMSIHSFGAAIDINPGDYDNDYFLGFGNDLRDKSNPYCIPDEVIEIFEKYGWFWGGNFNICADTMHFQYLGLDFLGYQGNEPFRVLEVKDTPMEGNDVNSLQKRLIRLGYSTYIDGRYTETTAQAVRRFQEDQGFIVTGIMDYKSWESIVNLTHDMEYVF